MASPPAGSGRHSPAWRCLARTSFLLALAAQYLRVEGQGTLAYTAVVPNAGDLTSFLVNHISTANVAPAAMTPEINAISTNHAAYQAEPTSETLHPVVMGIVDYMANPAHLDAVRNLEQLNPAYKLVQEQMATRRQQQCVDLLNSQRKLGHSSKIPQDAIDCICDNQGKNIPYYVCNARYHQVLVPAVMDYVGNNTGPGNGTKTNAASASGRRRLLHDTVFSPEDMSRPNLHDERMLRKAGGRLLPDHLLGSTRRRLQAPVAAPAPAPTPARTQYQSVTPPAVPSNLLIDVGPINIGAVNANAANLGAVNAGTGVGVSFKVLPYDLRELSLNFFNVTNTGKQTLDPVSAAAGRYTRSTTTNAAALTSLSSILSSNLTGNGSLPAGMTGVVYGGFTLAELVAAMKLNHSDLTALTSNKALTTPAPSVLGDSTSSCGTLLQNGVKLFANLLQNHSPSSFACSTTWPIAEYPAFIKFALSVNLPGVNFYPIDGSTGQTTGVPFAIEICEANNGQCTKFCPPGVKAADGTCNSGKYIDSRVVEQLAMSNIQFDFAVCLGLSGGAVTEVYTLLSNLLTILGLDPCPVHGGVTIFPFVLTVDGYVSLGLGFVDIKADVELKVLPDGGFTKQICDYLQEGYDTPTDNPAFNQVKCRPYCYQNPGDGTFKVAAELHILWFAWSWTLFQTNFGPDANGGEPLLCEYPPVGVYAPPNGRNDTLYGPAVIPGGTELISANGMFALRFSTDGDIELYDSPKAGNWPDIQPGDNLLWLTNTFGTGFTFNLLEGGDLQVQDASGRVLWNTNTDGYVLGKPYLTVTNDGRILLRDTHNNLCYWDSTGQCKDGIKYWPAGFSDSLSTNFTHSTACIDKNTMLVSKNRKYALAAIANSWVVMGQGMDAVSFKPSNLARSLSRTITCPGNVALTGPFCISSADLSLPAYISSPPGNNGVQTWAAFKYINEGELNGPVHMTIGDDGELGMWDYGGGQVFSFKPGDGQPDTWSALPPGLTARWIGTGLYNCQGLITGDDSVPLS